MKLIQIFLPLSDRDGNPFSKNLYDDLKDELAKRYKGITAYTQNPAEGLWAEGGKIEGDRIIIYEVMTENLDHYWWLGFKKNLEVLFKQDEILIRCLNIELL